MAHNNTIYIVRHGETEYNIQGIMQGGNVDSPLTANGIKQAESLSKIFKDIEFDLFFSSDLERARKTAEIILGDKNLKVLISPLLRERSYGKYEGQPSKNFREENLNKFELIKTLSRAEKRKIKFADDVESDKEITDRLLTFLKENLKDVKNKNILIVAHGGIMGAFLNYLDWNKEKDIKSSSIKNTAYIRLKSDGDNLIIEEVVGVDEK